MSFSGKIFDAFLKLLDRDLVACQNLKALHEPGVNVPCDKADPLVFPALFPGFQRTLAMQVLSERELRFTTQSIGKSLHPRFQQLHQVMWSKRRSAQPVTHPNRQLPGDLVVELLVRLPVCKSEPDVADPVLVELELENLALQEVHLVQPGVQPGSLERGGDPVLEHLQRPCIQRHLRLQLKETRTGSATSGKIHHMVGM